MWFIVCDDASFSLDHSEHLINAAWLVYCSCICVWSRIKQQKIQIWQLFVSLFNLWALQMLSTDFKKRPMLRNRLQQQNHIVEACWPDATLTSCNKLCEQCNPAPTIKQAWSLFRPSHTPSISTCLLGYTRTFLNRSAQQESAAWSVRMQLFHRAVFFIIIARETAWVLLRAKKKRNRMEHEFEEFGDFLRTPLNHHHMWPWGEKREGGGGGGDKVKYEIMWTVVEINCVHLQKPREAGGRRKCLFKMKQKHERSIGRWGVKEKSQKRKS